MVCEITRSGDTLEDRKTRFIERGRLVDRRRAQRHDPLAVPKLNYAIKTSFCPGRQLAAFANASAGYQNRVESCQSDRHLRTAWLRPVEMEKLTSGSIHALVRVGSEIVSLGLQKIRRQS